MHYSYTLIILVLFREPTQLIIITWKQAPINLTYYLISSCFFNLILWQGHTKTLQYGSVLYKPITVGFQWWNVILINYPNCNNSFAVSLFYAVTRILRHLRKIYVTCCVESLLIHHCPLFSVLRRLHNNFKGILVISSKPYHNTPGKGQIISDTIVSTNFSYRRRKH